jgi:hypothetical protein
MNMRPASQLLPLSRSEVSVDEGSSHLAILPSCRPPDLTLEIAVACAQAHINGPWVEIEVVPCGSDAFPLQLFWPSKLPPPCPEQVRPSRKHRETAFRRLRKESLLFVFTDRQDGDWDCNACGHTNWRRRKVCQKCFPCTCYHAALSLRV